MPSSKKLARVLFGLAISVTGVVGGHFVFEPKVGHARSSIFKNAAGLQSSIGENKTGHDPFAHSHDLDRRWVYIDNSNPANPNGFRLWPDKTIKFCFANRDSKAKLHDLIIEAMKMWYTAGLDESFKMVEVSDTECANNRPNVLYVEYNAPRSQGGQSLLSTTPAKPNIQNPSMVLSDDPTVGMLNALSNVAHEIGHAWGMLHEHQNPYFWPTNYAGMGGTAFSAINWICQNLADYQQALARVDAKIASEPNGLGDVLYGSHKVDMCFKRDVAGIYGFSAKEYLPLIPRDFYVAGTTDKEDVDWDSIMLYPSGAGGKDDGAGGRLPVLRRNNGDAITPNLVPSTRDVDGLTKLYGLAATSETLLSDGRNPGAGRFTDVRNTDIGVACT